MTLPRYKRDAFVFVSNLKSFTANEEAPTTFRRDAYLLSEHYTNSGSRALADDARRRRNLLISDNGNYSRMKAVAARFDDRGRALLERARLQREAGGVELETMRERRALMTEIARACRDAETTTDHEAVLARQLSIDPHYTIGAEDLTIPVWMLCSLLDPAFEPSPAEVREHQRRTNRRFAEQQRALATEGVDVANFLVLHAHDYASARQAGAAARSIPKAGIALSYGGPMHSKRWIDHVDVAGERHALGRRLPESYLAAVAITLGATDGHGGDVPVHILGLGSPILVALLGGLLGSSPAVSIDSTAPFRDAFAGVIYGSRRAYLKMNMYKVAAWHLVDGRPFRDRSPFFTEFDRRYPADWGALREALGVRANDSVSALARTLKTRGDLLRRYAPYFTPMHGSLDDAFEDALRIARSGYNYWVLRNICNAIKARRGDAEALDAWTRRQADRYRRIAHPKWAAAVDWCLRLMALDRA